MYVGFANVFLARAEFRVTGNPEVTVWATTRHRPASTGKIGNDKSPWRLGYRVHRLAEGFPRCDRQ